jgi:DNA-binding beta-propeller fold protein YncE
MRVVATPPQPGSVIVDMQPDVTARKLYIAHRPATNAGDGARPGITVLDMDTLSPHSELADISATRLLIDDQSRAFFELESGVWTFDSRAGAIGKRVDGIRGQGRFLVADRLTRKLYRGSEHSDMLDVIDPVTATRVTAAPLSGVPVTGVVDGQGRLYVLLEGLPSTVAVLDLTSLTVVRRYGVVLHSRCTHLAVDAARQLLFVACRGSAEELPMMAIQRLKDGETIAIVRLGGEPLGVAIHAPAGHVLCAHDDGTFTVIKVHTSNLFEANAIDVRYDADAMSFDDKTGHVFLGHNGAGEEPSTVIEIGLR